MYIVVELNLMATSTPSSSCDDNSNAAKRDTKELISMAEDAEKEIERMLSYLKENNVGMTEPLVNEEGFPRADIDVYGVRTARNHIICLRNDLKSLMAEIEAGLHAVHADARLCHDPGTESRDQKESTRPEFSGRISNEPFLVVSQVAAASPAAEAGLKDDDVLIAFGSICHANFKDMQQVAELTQNSQDKPVRVTVLRNGHAVHLVLKPKSWSGKGLLGCFIKPMRQQR